MPIWGGPGSASGRAAPPIRSFRRHKGRQKGWADTLPLQTGRPVGGTRGGSTASPVENLIAGVAQWQRSGFVNRRSQFRSRAAGSNPRFDCRAATPVGSPNPRQASAVNPHLSPRSRPGRAQAISAPPSRRGREANPRGAHVRLRDRQRAGDRHPADWARRAPHARSRGCRVADMASGLGQRVSTAGRREGVRIARVGFAPAPAIQIANPDRVTVYVLNTHPLSSNAEADYAPVSLPRVRFLEGA